MSCNELIKVGSGGGLTRAGEDEQSFATNILILLPVKKSGGKVLPPGLISYFPAWLHFPCVGLFG